MATRATAARRIKTIASNPYAEYVMLNTLPMPDCADAASPDVFREVWSVPMAYIVTIFAGR